MRAYIPLPSGDYAIADYDQKKQTWEIDHGLSTVYVPAGWSAFPALLDFYPMATLES